MLTLGMQVVISRNSIVHPVSFALQNSVACGEGDKEQNIWPSVGQINFWVIISVRSKVKEVILELKDANS